MTSFEETLSAAERFVDAAAAVCGEGRRLGAQVAFVWLLYDDGPIAMCVDNATDFTDEHRLFAVSERHWRANPIFRVLRHEVALLSAATTELRDFLAGTARFPVIAPLVGPRGSFGLVGLGMQEVPAIHCEHQLAIVAARLSVWCNAHGIAAVPRQRAGERLGPRQHQIAELAARGLTNDEVAAELKISVNTVKTRLKEVFEALDVRNRTELVHVLRRHAPPGEVPPGVTRVGDVTVTRAPEGRVCR